MSTAVKNAKTKDELVLGNDILVCPVITKGTYDLDTPLNSVMV